MSSTVQHPHVSRLPIEIWEEIISCIHSYKDEEQKTLSACALACKSWLPKSRALLYRFPDVKGKGIHKFVDTIVNCPDRGANIERLSLSVRWNSAKGGYDEVVDEDEKVNDKNEEGEKNHVSELDSRDTSHGLTVYRFLSEVSPLLPKLTSMSYFRLSIPYPHLPLCPSPSLTSLTLWNIEADSFGDFVCFVSFHEHLKELTIHECSWERSSVRHYSFAMHWGRDLQKLKITYCEYQKVFDILRWLGRSNTSVSVQCLEIENLEFSEQPVVPFVADHLATQWATTMKAISLIFDDEINGVGDAKEAVVFSLTTYIRCCPNLQTVKLQIWYTTLWVLQQIPDVLSGLASLRRIVFQILANANIALLGGNEGSWMAVDKNLADVAKFTSLEYVELFCCETRGHKVPDWWENDIGRREDGQSGNGREFDCEDREMGSREECDSEGRGRGGEGKQQLQGIPWGVELSSDRVAGLRATMNGIADFHRRKKRLTDIFPRLSARDVLWCGIQPIGGSPYYVLHITPFNLSEMSSPNWCPRHRKSSFYQDFEYN
ncbi:hypothetical protein NLI96_g5798 [Meripilus lineatus]|uniref:F-box domain-containing protein n=1 Tax=Meripilus lineatus TaxID=2056292 RepID=A0AAD5YIQ4_9APHY|nr:hypothetical protein NLI96_g5798 [Physisporinus lineatus]